MGYFAVQTFARSGRGALQEDTPLICKTRDQAIRTAKRLSLTKAGAVAFERSSNEFDEYAAPHFLAAHGSIPDYMADDLPAELAAVMATEDTVTDRPVNSVNLELKSWTELL